MAGKNQSPEPEKQPETSTIPSNYLADALKASSEAPGLNGLPSGVPGNYLDTLAPPAAPGESEELAELDADESPPEKPKSKKRPRRRTQKKPAKPQRKSAKRGKTRMTFTLPPALCNQLRRTVDRLKGPPTNLTLSSLAEVALKRELDRITKARKRKSAQQQKKKTRTRRTTRG